MALRTVNTPHDTLYYDGACGLCRRSTRVLGALDWLGRLRFQDSTALPEKELPVARAASLVGVPMRTRRGSTLIGFPAVRRALAQTPLGCVPALALYLPGVSHTGRWMYARIAARRARDVGSCGVRAHRAGPDQPA